MGLSSSPVDTACGTIPGLPSNFSPFPTVDEVTDAEAGGRRLMAGGEAERGAGGLGTVGSDRRGSPERKVARQAPGKGTEASSQGAHGRGETGEAGGCLGNGRGRREPQVRGGGAQGLQFRRLGSSRAPGTRGCGRARLPPPLPLPSEVPVVEHLLAVWVQGPVIAFTCGRRKGPDQKIRDLTEVM